MVQTIKDYKFPISIGTIVGLSVFLVISAFKGGIEVSSAESLLNAKIQVNTSDIILLKQDDENLEDKLETHINYSYTIKADLKEEINKNSKKLDTVINLMLTGKQ